MATNQLLAVEPLDIKYIDVMIENTRGDLFGNPLLFFIFLWEVNILTYLFLTFSFKLFKTLKLELKLSKIVLMGGNIEKGLVINFWEKGIWLPYRWTKTHHC